MPFRRLNVVVAAALAAGCASTVRPQTATGPAPTQAALPLRADAGSTTSIPPGVSLDDGLTPDEAVAIALWNSAEFRVQLTDLGFARADLLEAGLLKNPVLSLLFPLGPKQLEATLRWPVEVLWERPRRVAAARLNVDRVASALEQSGLNLAAEVKLAYLELTLARDRAQLAKDAAGQLEQIRTIAAARLREGDISELEARSATIDAARAEQDAVRAGHDAQLRLVAFRSRLGLSLDPAIRLDVPPPSTEVTVGASCVERSAGDLLPQALAARPDVRAAEIAVEAAGARMGWEKSRIMTLSAVIDANGQGREGFEMGPGVDASLPIFDRNQGGRARASAEMQRAALGYLAARQRVASEVDEALTLLSQARTSQASWRTSIVVPLDDQVKAAERAYAAGDMSYLFVLENARRLTEARLRGREVDADLARAVVRVERAIGRSCTR